MAKDINESQYRSTCANENEAALEPLCSQINRDIRKKDGDHYRAIEMQDNSPSVPDSSLRCPAQACGNVNSDQ